MKNIEDIIAKFPKKRINLDEKYASAHSQNYKKNRIRSNIDHKLSGFAESWSHKIIAKNNFNKNKILEVGAGNLNHVPYEKNYERYDVVEPWSELINTSIYKTDIDDKYNYLNEIKDKTYNRIISIFTFEHLENLPNDIEFIKNILTKNGVLQVAIPCEGELAFKIGWMFTTGLMFKIRYGLDYSKIMKYEHINTLDEIIILLRYFFSNIKILRSPLILPIKLFICCYIGCHNLK